MRMWAVRCPPLGSGVPGQAGRGLILERGISPRSSERCQPFPSRSEELSSAQAAQAAGAGVPQAQRDRRTVVTPVGAGSEGRAPGLPSPPKYTLCPATFQSCPAG